MSALCRILVALVATGSSAAIADPVWDPTEIARLSEQTAQLANNLSAAIDNLQAFSRLAAEVGAAGSRSSIASQMPSPLAGYKNLQPMGVPSGSDALSLITSPPTTATTQQQSRQQWSATSRTAAAEGLAVSQVATQDVAAAKSRSQALAAAAVSTQDLRDDVQANSAVCLALLTELGTVQAVLALLLEQESLGRIASTYSRAG